VSLEYFVISQIKGTKASVAASQTIVKSHRRCESYIWVLDLGLHAGEEQVGRILQMAGSEL
jgi:hypothetical protein